MLDKFFEISDEINPNTFGEMADVDGHLNFIWLNFMGFMQSSCPFSITFSIYFQFWNNVNPNFKYQWISDFFRGKNKFDCHTFFNSFLMNLLDFILNKIIGSIFNEFTKWIALFSININLTGYNNSPGHHHKSMNQIS